MNRAVVHLVILLLFLAACSCRRPSVSPLIPEVDSLIARVRELNQSIISANLDSLQQVYSVIGADHALLSDNSVLLAEHPLYESVFRKLDSLTLIIGLCLDACNAFHMEISSIENHLENIRERLTSGDQPDSLLIPEIGQEAYLLIDLKERLSLRMGILQEQFCLYYEIQPVIEEYRQQTGPGPAGEGS